MPRKVIRSKYIRSVWDWASRELELTMNEFVELMLKGLVVRRGKLKTAVSDKAIELSKDFSKYEREFGYDLSTLLLIAVQPPSLIGELKEVDRKRQVILVKFARHTLELRAYEDVLDVAEYILKNKDKFGAEVLVMFDSTLTVSSLRILGAVKVVYFKPKQEEENKGETVERREVCECREESQGERQVQDKKEEAKRLIRALLGKEKLPESVSEASTSIEVSEELVKAVRLLYDKYEQIEFTLSDMLEVMKLQTDLMKAFIKRKDKDAKKFRELVDEVRQELEFIRERRRLYVED